MFGNAFAYGTTHGGSGSFFDAATMCIFSAFPFFAIFGPPPETARTFINAAAGWDLTGPQMGEIIQRISYLGRCVSLREGFHPDKDSWLPQRAFDEPTKDKYGRTWVWTKDEWEAARKKHYLENLKLSERGLPPREGLQKLGLDFVIPVLGPLDALG